MWQTMVAALKCWETRKRLNLADVLLASSFYFPREGSMFPTGTVTHKLYWHAANLQSKLRKQFLEYL